MNRSRLQELFVLGAGHRIVTIDSHTAGEPTRLIVSGVDSVPGRTMVEKRRHCAAFLDHVRLALTREPRGHRDLFAALLTDAVTPGARFGLVYMDARRYPYLCGHGTIGAVTTLIETGLLTVSAAEAEVVVDTPAGPLATRVRTAGGKVQSVSLNMVPSFVYAQNQRLQVPGHGSLAVDIVYAGGFFLMVPIRALGLTFAARNHARFVRLGMELVDLANQQLRVTHPHHPEVSTIDVVEFYDDEGIFRGQSQGIVIYGEAHMDRSPCGTGTTAKLTLLERRFGWPAGRWFVNSGPLETRFDARIIAASRVGEYPAVIVEVRGAAHITGFHQFVIAPDDPFPQGFLL